MLKQNAHAHVDTMIQFWNRSTSALTEEDSHFAPKPGMLTVAQTVGHTAQTFDWFIEGAFSESGFDLDFESMAKSVQEFTSLAEARKALVDAVARTKAAIDGHTEEEWNTLLPPGPIMAGVPRAGIFEALSDHTAHHRGVLAVYTRLLDKVPPMPYA